MKATYIKPSNKSAVHKIAVKSLHDLKKNNNIKNNFIVNAKLQYLKIISEDIQSKKIQMIALAGFDWMCNLLIYNAIMTIFRKINIDKVLNPIVYKICNFINEKAFNNKYTKNIEQFKSNSKNKDIGSKILAFSVATTLVEESSKIATKQLGLLKEYTIVMSGINLLTSKKVTLGHLVTKTLTSIVSSLLHKVNKWLAIFFRLSSTIFISLIFDIILKEDKSTENIIKDTEKEVYEIKKEKDLSKEYDEKQKKLDSTFKDIDKELEKDNMDIDNLKNLIDKTLDTISNGKIKSTIK